VWCGTSAAAYHARSLRSAGTSHSIMANVMSSLQLAPIDPDNAPEAIADTLADVRARYGFLPNLYRYFAHAPGLLKGYLALSDLFAQGSFSAMERNVVMLAVSRENACHYCVAVHSSVADMQRDDTAVTDAIRNGTPIGDPRLEALRRLAQALVRGRGLADEEVATFLEVGYEPHQVLEVVLGIGLKTLSNTTNHLVATPLDPVFAKRAWPE